MDLIGVGFLGASSSSASGPIRSARRCWLGTRSRSGRHPEARSDAAAEAYPLGGWLTAECGFDAARRLLGVIEAQASVAGRDR
jgi:hypothetical protein